MAQYTFLSYAWLRIKVAMLRLLVRVILPFALRQDKTLATSTGIVKQRIQLPTRDPHRNISADLYYPPYDHTLLSTSAPRPVLINWHGSGFILSLLGSDSLYCAQMALSTGMMVLDADYRKAPEFPYPKPIEDVEDTLLWVASQPERFDLSRVCVSGFSAGANLALVAATALRTKLEDTIRIPVAISIYPLSDHSIAPEKKVVPKPVGAFSPAQLHMFSDCYVPDKSMRTDPCVSPGLADVESFPDTVVVVTCEGDNLGPEGLALVERLEKDGGERKVISWVAEGLPHGFDKGAKEGSKKWAAREKAYEVCVEALKEGLGL
ncbi:alpha/beta-hydrolase [Melanomma pulvis-pyrius CBS 109.77]|uniref:Alpha/beta-hydrolase n=1 Tax=Melanomma pulvis-pyrius CBS 109.77 TaxID=1314802 RepID=A0A6A6XLP0_9PLEO|nr:alpha/beta-hydrolase [Melanomma pulvis-pyrius CBS 109.77]